MSDKEILLEQLKDAVTSAKEMEVKYIEGKNFPSEEAFEHYRSSIPQGRIEQLALDLGLLNQQEAETFLIIHEQTLNFNSQTFFNSRTELREFLEMLLLRAEAK